MATLGTDDAGVATDDAGNNAWNPGIQSQVPPDLQHLCTIFRPENAFGSLADAQESFLITEINFDIPTPKIVLQQRLEA